jgi:hypothetical protein
MATNLSTPLRLPPFRLPKENTPFRRLQTIRVAPSHTQAISSSSSNILAANGFSGVSLTVT